MRLVRGARRALAVETVWLDDVIQKDVIVADDEAGFIVRFCRNAHGSVYEDSRRRGRLARERVEGEVSFDFKGDGCES